MKKGNYVTEFSTQIWKSEKKILLKYLSTTDLHTFYRGSFSRQIGHRRNQCTDRTFC